MKLMKYQQGGQAPMPAEAPAPEQDPIMMIADMFAQGLQNQDCGMLAQGAEMFLQMVSQAQGGQAPVGEVPAGEPVFKKGGKMVKRQKCAKK